MKKNLFLLFPFTLGKTCLCNFKRITTTALTIISFSMISNAGTSYLFSYDDNGNRITVTYINNCKQSQPTDSTIQDTIMIKELKYNISEISPKVYPNPINDYFIVNIPDLTQSMTLTIYDMYGNIIMEEDNIYTSKTIVRSCAFASGTYIIRITDNNGTLRHTSKITKL